MVAFKGQNRLGRTSDNFCALIAPDKPDRAARLSYSYPGVDAKGNVREDWVCGECGQQENRIYRPGAC